MAKTLMDTIRGNLEQPGGQSQQADQTERTQSLLRAKLGKAGGIGTTPRISSIQEQQAQQQTRLGQQRQQTEGMLRGAELGQQERAIQVREQEQLADIGERRQDIEQRFNLQSSNILSELEREGRKLDDKRQTAKMEQLGFQLRLQDKAYLADLEREGRRARLDDSLSFKEQLAKDNFADMEELFRDKIDFRQLANMSDREFKEELARMDANYAMEMAHEAEKQQAKMAKWQAIGTIAGAGASAYGKGAFTSGSGEGGEN